MHNSITKKGFSLVEMLIYVSILSVILGVITSALYSMNSAYKTMRLTETVESSSITALDRIVREIRDAKSVDAVNSTFDVSPGVLTLNTTDEAGASHIVKFSVTSQIIHVTEDGVDIGPLTDSSTRVTNLVFRSISTAQSKAVKVEMTIESGSGATYKSKKFYSTVVLRGSYTP